MKTTTSLKPAAKQPTTAKPAVTTPDYITVLIADADYMTSKKHTRAEDGGISTQDFNAGMFFTMLELPAIDDIGMLSNYLTELESIPTALIIRGLPLDHVEKGERVRRLKLNFATPAWGHRWVLIDIDHHPIPQGLSIKDGAQAVVDHLVRQLPTEFHGASHHWQLSSSAGIKNDGTVSAHLWFILTKPVTDVDLKRWGLSVNEKIGYKLIDTALFNDVQPHFTASPQFIGMEDPLSQRSGYCQKSQNSVNLQLPPTVVVTRSMSSTAGQTSRGNGGAGFQHFLNQIGDHPGGDGFHMPIVQAVASYIAEHGAEGVDVEHLCATVRDRVLAADASKHSQSEVADRAGDVHIRSAIASALRKYGDDATQRRKSRRIEGLKPYYTGEFHEATTIKSRLNSILDKAF